MATVIDSLSIALSLDTEGVKKGEAQTKKSMAVVQKNAKETGRELKNATTGMLKFFAVAFGASGFASMAQDIIKVNTALANVSQRTGQSASSLKSFNQYVESLGESGDAAAQTLVKISQYAQNVKFGILDEGIALFNRFGVSMYDANNNAKQATTLLKDLAVAMEKTKMTDADKATALTLAGYDAGTIQVILKGSAALQEVIDAGEKNKDTIDKQAKAAKELTEQVAKLRKELDAIANDALLKAEPYIIEAFRWIATNGDVVESALVGIATVLTMAMTPALLSMTTALLPALLAITAVSAAYSEYLKIKRGDKDALDPKKVKEGAGLYWDDAKKWMKGKLYPNRTEKTADDIAAEKFLKSGKSIGGKNASKGSGDDQKRIYDKLIQKGMTPDQAAGMTANIMAESNGVFSQKEIGGGPGYGLLQWGKRRRADFKKVTGLDMQDSDENMQLDFLMWELENTEKSAGAKKTGTARDFAEHYNRKFIRPLDQSKRDRVAGNRAEMMALGYGGGYETTASAQMPSMKSNTGGAGGGGNSSEVNIGVLNVNTQATNATAIAGSIEAALKTNTLINQSNSGIN